MTNLIRVVGTFGIDIVPDDPNLKDVSKEIVDQFDCEVWSQATFKMAANETPTFGFGDVGIAVRVLMLFCDNPIHINFGISGPPNLYVRSIYVATYKPSDLPDYIHLFNDIVSGATNARIMIGGDAVAPF